MMIAIIFQVYFIFFNWGFFAHKKINEIAVYTLPVEMNRFFKSNMDEIIEGSVKPDMRRYSNPLEGFRHYIDLDRYPDSLQKRFPLKWKSMIDYYGDSVVKVNGIAPWHIMIMKDKLTKAFIDQDESKIIKYASEMGHYVADANVPLHTTSNYNGQFTDQIGIHGLWETRLPELFFQDFDLYTGRAEYLHDPSEVIWNLVAQANVAVDSVFRFEKELSSESRFENKYAVVSRNGIAKNDYSFEFSEAYYKKLDGMIERQLRRSIKCVGSLWYTCWVDAGQPDLNPLTENAVK
jgi:hypothetical protein